MLTLSEAIPPTDNEGPLPTPLTSWDSFAPGDLLLCVKGAPEVLLGRFSHVISGADRPLFLTYAARQRIVTIQEQWAAQGRRVLLLARRVVPRDALPKEIDPFSDEFNALVDSLNSDLIIVGMVGLIDPLKPDIPDTVRYAISSAREPCPDVFATLPPSGYVVVLESASSLSLATTLLPQ